MELRGSVRPLAARSMAQDNALLQENYYYLLARDSDADAAGRQSRASRESRASRVTGGRLSSSGARAQPSSGLRASGKLVDTGSTTTTGTGDKETESSERSSASSDSMESPSGAPGAQRASSSSDGGSDKSMGTGSEKSTDTDAKETESSERSSASSDSMESPSGAPAQRASSGSSGGGSDKSTDTSSEKSTDTDAKETESSERSSASSDSMESDPLTPADVTAAAARAQQPRVSVGEIRTLDRESRLDTDRISTWHRGSRVTQVDDAHLVLPSGDCVAQTRVRGQVYLWSFRDRWSGKNIANVAVDAEGHPVARLIKLDVCEAYVGQGCTAPVWAHVEEALTGFKFEDIVFEAASSLPQDIDPRSSLALFYEGRGIDLSELTRTDPACTNGQRPECEWSMRPSMAAVPDTEDDREQTNRDTDCSDRLFSCSRRGISGRMSGRRVSTSYVEMYQPGSMISEGSPGVEDSPSGSSIEGSLRHSSQALTRSPASSSNDSGSGALWSGGPIAGGSGDPRSKSVRFRTSAETVALVAADKRASCPPQASAHADGAASATSQDVFSSSHGMRINPSTPRHSAVSAVSAIELSQDDITPVRKRSTRRCVAC